MKRLVFILFLSFSTVTFFANEKSEALPDLNNFTEEKIADLKLINYQAKKDLFQILWITSIPLLSTSVSLTITNIILNVMPPLHKSMLAAYVAIGTMSITTFVCGLTFLVVGVCCGAYWKKKLRQIISVQENDLQLAFVYSFGGKR